MNYLSHTISHGTSKSGNRITRPTLPRRKNIHLGPTLPAFLSPNVAKVLVDNFGIAGIGSVDEDMELFLGK